MSKNRRKSLKKEPVIPKTDFSFYESKIYIIATIIMFHIVPLDICYDGRKRSIITVTIFPYDVKSNVYRIVGTYIRNKTGI